MFNPNRFWCPITLATQNHVSIKLTLSLAVESPHLTKGSRNKKVYRQSYIAKNFQIISQVLMIWCRIKVLPLVVNYLLPANRIYVTNIQCMNFKTLETEPTKYFSTVYFAPLVLQIKNLRPKDIRCFFLKAKASVDSNTVLFYFTILSI
jgi:hypothetical protein